MLKKSLLRGIPSEIELKLYFYGYDHSDITGDSERGFNGLPRLRVRGIPNTPDGPMETLGAYDVKLAAYSFGGLASLNIYRDKDELTEYLEDYKRIKLQVEGFVG